MSKSLSKILRTGFSKARFLFKKEAPTILIFGGLLGLGVSTVAACVQTTKLEPVIEEAKDDLVSIKRAQKAAADGYLEYEKKEVVRDTVLAYGKAAWNVAKVYSVPTVLFIGSTVSVLSGCKIFKKRHASLAAAFVAVDTGFKKYRQRVAERYGTDAERQIRFNLKEKTIDVNNIETGEKETVSILVAEQGTDGIEECGGFTKVFDQSQHKRIYGSDYTYDLAFINIMLSTLNNNFYANNVLFVNQALKAFGFNETKKGQVVGWYRDPNDPNAPSCINVQVHEVMRPIDDDERNGFEKVFILDFIPDGNILDVAFDE